MKNLKNTSSTKQPQISCVMSYDGIKICLTTDLELKGRGITVLSDGSGRNDGKKRYKVTPLAFEKLKLKYTTCFETFLD
jgi:hypothetical protein